MNFFNKNNKKKKRPRVALIGCGAAGMSFLRALVLQYHSPSEGNNDNDKKKKKRNGKEDEEKLIPLVTCFERASSPGGCWRSKEDSNEEDDGSVWYSQVWTNLIKETLEYPDYTFHDYAVNITATNNNNNDKSNGDHRQQQQENHHYYSGAKNNNDTTATTTSTATTNKSQQSTNNNENQYENSNHNNNKNNSLSMPTFLPRNIILDYVLKRTTLGYDSLLHPSSKNDKKKFRHDLYRIWYNTTVTHVSFDETSKIFTLQYKSSQKQQQRKNGTHHHHHENNNNDNMDKATALLSSLLFINDTHDDNQQFNDNDTTTFHHEEEQFDYVVWAAGLRGRPRIPRSTLHLLKTGFGMNDEGQPTQDTPFLGTIFHSHHVTALLQELKHQGASNATTTTKKKNIVLIGDSNAAEDLALYSLARAKDYIQTIYILSRSGFGDCVYMGDWPKRRNANKEDEWESMIHVYNVVPFRVVENGTALQCARMTWSREFQAYEINEDDDLYEEVILHDVHVIVFCTGHIGNMDFLEPSLQPHYQDEQHLDENDNVNNNNNNNIGQEIHSSCWSAPPDFKMAWNPFEQDLGHVSPSPILEYSGNLLPGLFRTLLKRNSQMMFLLAHGSEYPLLQLDVEAWLALAYITKQCPIPSRQDMENATRRQLLQEMNVAYLRWSMDSNYFRAMYNLGSNHWSDNYQDERTIQVNQDYYAHNIGLIADMMQSGNYQIKVSNNNEEEEERIQQESTSFLGSYGNLTSLGQRLVALGAQNVYMRHTLHPRGDEQEWMTYRDNIVDYSALASAFTGTCPIPLERPWLDMANEDDDSRDQESS